MRCVGVERQLAEVEVGSASWRRLRKHGLDAWSVAGRTDLMEFEKDAIHELREVLKAEIHSAGWVPC